jgi:hypothetical protein
MDTMRQIKSKSGIFHCRWVPEVNAFPGNYTCPSSIDFQILCRKKIFPGIVFNSMIDKESLSKCLKTKGLPQSSVRKDEKKIYK